MRPPAFVDADLAGFASLVPGPEPADPATAREMIRAFSELEAPGRDVLIVTDRTVPGLEGGPPVAVRMYDPGRIGEPRPAVVVLHGGGFIAGDLDTENARCTRYAAETGCVAIAVDYRLAPEHPFPAAVHDCDAVVQWVAGAAAELGVDSARIGIAGVSAGGALASSVALLDRDRGDHRLAFQLLVCPVLDDRMTTESTSFVGTPLLDGPAVRTLWRYYLGDRHDTASTSPYAAPARVVEVSGLPPTYVLTAELDPLRDEALEFALRLLGAGVSVELRNVAGAFHGFDTLPTDLSRRAVDEQVTWIRRVTRR